ncbi:polyprenyl synthetase family protein [Hydrogenimonas thermophila]|uniref:Farnesyl diphosphate synthase n=1 Tax=Hydrogenimonas thermophila TaxID=223786 RepID=A0A1I5RBH8_9BACT|nr:polyprenyl synthetase family protein [Hydrogenimonas thermophila]WOE69744.1 polyprenyl synthetase family protein [Hydrogenimonas thermophila]WOE72258.1 polyprenyl synthetase family protein [Hydrogenimonas thermophila]SFP55869.1 farnesyl diphosphate synthase [Hydrogenimonas thermophila]
MQKFESYLTTHLPEAPSFHPTFNEALKAMLLAGGKRFRPQLLLAVVDAYEPMICESAYPVAMALEMLHTYSLIHDDLPVMDDADLRRGEPTLHKRYDEVTAVLVGDALNTHAFYMIATAPLHNDVKVALIKELSYSGGIGGMVLGQAIDCYFEGEKLAAEQIDFLHEYKTGRLIAASLKMGAIIAGLDEKEQEELFKFGLDLGLLFQIQDDIIDVTQSSCEAGKTTGNDEDKNSYINHFGLEGSLKRADNLAEKIKEQMANFDLHLKDKLEPILNQYLNRHKG